MCDTQKEWTITGEAVPGRGQERPAVRLAQGPIRPVVAVVRAVLPKMLADPDPEKCKR